MTMTNTTLLSSQDFLFIANLICATDAVYFEARGEEHPNATAAVLEVINNRVVDPTFPDTICGVVYDRGAFSFVQQNSGLDSTSPPVEDRTTWKNLAYKHAASIQSISANAKRGLRYHTSDPLGRADGCYATHYLNKRATREWRQRRGLKNDYPRWVYEYHELKTVGNHTFYSMYVGACRNE